MKNCISSHFISMRKEFNKFDSFVPAPLFRREFSVTKPLKSAKISISSLGYYELHINGVNITKGAMAPYRSNPEHYIYFDEYNLSEKLNLGNNCIGVILGNGFQNSIVDGWDFRELPWASAPAVSFALELEYTDSTKEILHSDNKVKCADSPILFNDFHYGEYYDARLEQTGWDEPDFDDKDWINAFNVVAPKGEIKLCPVEPIVVKRELTPVSIRPYEDGFIYDFGEDNAGVCKLNIDGKEGQKLLLIYFETLVANKPYTDNLRFQDKTVRFQEQEYTCSGGKTVHIPRFTYFGFRYVYVKGITQEQATPELLTYLVMSSDINENGSFCCDNETVNRIQQATVRSDFSNFYYFPTDCPHREKNGWTADASLSAEQMILNITPENSYREWLLNIYKTMKPSGQLPGIIPTATWGYDWGNGPGWDNVIVYLPYYTYIYRKNTDILKELAAPLMTYLRYLQSCYDENGLIEIGLGDWSEVGERPGLFYTPLIVTASILTLDIATKAAFFYDVLGYEKDKIYAEKMALEMRRSIRNKLIDFNTMTVYGNTQTAQAMGIHYGLFEENEKKAAVLKLVELIHNRGDFIKVGVLGGRVIFRVLADNGYGELAFHMITRPEYPSYGNWVARGATTLFECFDPPTGKIESLNHHFWGDVSAWFYIYLGGMRYNPSGYDHNEINIKPIFIKQLGEVTCSFDCALGRVGTYWKRTGYKITLTVDVPEKAQGVICLPKGYAFENGKTEMPIKNGGYIIIQTDFE